MAEFKFLGSSIERKIAAIGKNTKMKDLMDALGQINKNDDSKCPSAHWGEVKTAFEKFGFTVVFDLNMAIITTALFTAIARSKCNKIYDWAKIVINRAAKPKSYNSEKSETQKPILLGQALLDGDGEAIYEILHCSVFIAILREIGIADKYINKYLNRMKKITPWRRADSKQALKVVGAAFEGMTSVEYQTDRVGTERLTLTENEDAGTHEIKVEGREEHESRQVADKEINALFDAIKGKFDTDLLPGLGTACRKAWENRNEVYSGNLDVTLENGGDLSNLTKYTGRYKNFTIYVEVDPQSPPTVPCTSDAHYKYTVRFDRTELEKHCRVCFDNSSKPVKNKLDAVAATYGKLIYDTVKGLVEPKTQVASDNEVLDVDKCNYAFDLFKDQFDKLMRDRKRGFEPLRRTTVTYKVFDSAKDSSPGNYKKISAEDEIYVKQITKPTKSNQHFEVCMEKSYLIDEYNKAAASDLRDVLALRANGWANRIMDIIYSRLGAEEGYQTGEDKWRYVFDLFTYELDRVKTDRVSRYQELKALKFTTINCDAFPRYYKKFRSNDTPNGEEIVKDTVYLKQLTKPGKKNQKFEVQLKKSGLVAEYDKVIVRDPSDRNKLKGDMLKEANSWAVAVLDKIQVTSRLTLPGDEVTPIERELPYALRRIRSSSYEVKEVKAVEPKDGLEGLCKPWGNIYGDGTFLDANEIVLGVDVSKSTKEDSGYRYYTVYFAPFALRKWANGMQSSTNDEFALQKVVNKCTNDVKAVIETHETEIRAGRVPSASAVGETNPADDGEAEEEDV